MFGPYVTCAAITYRIWTSEKWSKSSRQWTLNGRPYTVPKCAMVSSVGDGSGFNGRIDNIATVASFVYFGIVYYARKDAVEANTKPMVFASRRERKAASV